MILYTENYQQSLLTSMHYSSLYVNRNVIAINTNLAFHEFFQITFNLNLILSA
jgi:hypothetical protein